MRYALIIGSVILLSCSAWYWYVYTDAQQTVAGDLQKPPHPAVPIIDPLPGPRTPREGMREYRSEFYHFQLFYPDTFTVTVYPEAESGRTIVFSNALTGEQFQIFMIPYGAPAISDARIKTDIPGGVMDAPQHVTIDDISATAFLSYSSALGDLREIWFVNKGFLYEVTAPLSLDDWLAELITTWMFL